MIQTPHNAMQWTAAVLLAIALLAVSASVVLEVLNREQPHWLPDLCFASLAGVLLCFAADMWRLRS